MNGKFPSGISAATDSTLAYIYYMYTYKYNIYKNAFSFKLLEEAVIFKTLNTPFLHSLVRSLERLARSYCTHWKHLSLQERKVSTTLFRCSKRWIFDHPIQLVNNKKKRMNERSVSFDKRPEISIVYELLSPLYNFSFFGEGRLKIEQCSTRY